MTDCTDCLAAAKRAHHGFTANCRGCCARALARGPHFRRVREAGSLDRAYRLALEQFGLDHLEVRAAAQADFESKATP